MTPAERQALIDEIVANAKLTTVGWANHSVAWQNNTTTRWWKVMDGLKRLRADTDPVPPTPPPPSSSRKGWSSLWQSPDLIEEVDRMTAAGCKWVRIDMAWSQIEGSRGQPDWGYHDRLIDLAVIRKLNVLGVAAYAPSWASGAAGTDKMPPTNPADYGTFAGQLANRYGPKLLGAGCEFAIEAWNEPNINGFWGNPNNNGPEKLAGMLKAAYPKVKAADPRITVVTGGLSPAVSSGGDLDPRDYAVRLYAAGAGGSFDAFGMHPYYGPSPLTLPKDWSTWHQVYVPQGTPTLGEHGQGGQMSKRSIRETMAANGDANKKVWNTESNMKVQPVTRDGKTANEARQAEMAVEAYRLWSTFPWAGPFFLYNYRSHYPDFSIKRPDGSLRPLLNAYRDA